MVVAHYTDLMARSQTALTNMQDDEERLALFITAHNEAEDLDQLHKFLATRTEAPMYELARLEYQHALYSVSAAQYRQAHKSLRLFLELALCSVLFSAHEIDTHLWLKGRKDAKWGSINCENTGVFSQHFVGAFFDGMKEHCPQYQTLAAKLYRECSEFVHGNRQSYDGIDMEISYNADLLEAWTDRADTARLLVKFAFVSRYLNGANIDLRNELETLVLEDFGTLAVIQAIFEEPHHE
jgi:hypothetical protein